MDQNDTTHMTDDQELAKVLESMNEQAAQPAPVAEPVTDVTMTVDPADADVAALPTDVASIVPSDDMLQPEVPAEAPYLEPPVPAPAPTLPPEPNLSILPSANPELDGIKKDALEELRPLVDKLDLPADEKFDTLLLIIRSTDDKSLVGAAHEAARAIPDETKRAQALLDVIKEIDYFSGQSPQP